MSITHTGHRIHAVIDTFVSIHNVVERAVFAAIVEQRPEFPGLADREDLFADLACIALNRLMPRYVVHEVDLAFYSTNQERIEQDRLVHGAVRFAFEFLQARTAMRARS